MSTERLITKTDAIELLGISRGKFEKLELQPSKTRPNPHRKSTLMYLYDVEVIKKLITPKETEARKPKQRKPKDWNAIFDKRYNLVTDALEDACSALFNINRYAKYNSCSSCNREEIYYLKNSLIAYLYYSGYCNGIYKHRQRREHYIERYNRYSMHSYREYSHSYDYVYYVFSFDVNGTIYSWHQPEEQINFYVEEKDIISESKMPYIENNKPLNIERSKLTEAKELIRWFVKRAV